MQKRRFSKLKQHRQNKTTIITAHRLSGVMHAQEILVLNEGQHYLNIGTHEQLLAAKGWYQKMGKNNN